MRVVAGAPEGHAADEAGQTTHSSEPASEQVSGPTSKQLPAPVSGSEQTHGRSESTAEPAAQAPGFAERGRMRRRARFLRKAREVAYRDLGGLVFDLHRFGQRNDQLVLAKLATLREIDTELRGLEDGLRERRPVTVLREVGIAACPRCAAIHGSDDRFCPGCGLAFDANADRPISTAPVSPQPQALSAQAASPQTPPMQSSGSTHAGGPAPAQTSAIPHPSGPAQTSGAAENVLANTQLTAPGARFSEPAADPTKKPAPTSLSATPGPVPTPPSARRTPAEVEPVPPLKPTAPPVAASPGTPASDRKPLEPPSGDAEEPTRILRPQSEDKGA